MTRYARRPEGGRKRTGLMGTGFSRLGAMVARNPAAVGGTTAFLVSLSFVSANALWYQPQIHPSAFVSTRAPAAPLAAPRPAAPAEAAPAPTGSKDPIRRVMEQEAAAPVPAPAPESQSLGSVAREEGDETVRAVQKVLSDLGLYRGPVDGLTGPQTREAVANYRRIVGLAEGSQIDSALLGQLGLDQPLHTAGISVPVPAPKPAPRPAGASDPVQTASLGETPAGNGDPVIRRVQAGLRAFGNDGIEVDGVLGENTRAAIREFQSLFGLPVTGEPDEALMAKMREIGLTN